MPEVLKDLTFQLKEGEKVGIVGKTGAGKSSIIQAMLHMSEPAPGSIYRLGDVDALQLGLHTLRQRISIIPQTPFLFQGSLRLNLDPFSHYDEEAIWEALEKCSLKPTIEKLP